MGEFRQKATKMAPRSLPSASQEWGGHQEQLGGGLPSSAGFDRQDRPGGVVRRHQAADSREAPFLAGAQGRAGGDGIGEDRQQQRGVFPVSSAIGAPGDGGRGRFPDEGSEDTRAVHADACRCPAISGDDLDVDGVGVVDQALTPGDVHRAKWRGRDDVGSFPDAFGSQHIEADSSGSGVRVLAKSVADAVGRVALESEAVVPQPGADGSDASGRRADVDENVSIERGPRQDCSVSMASR